ncbi:MAG: Hsp20/alpha crystallin family protein [Chloroflexi bacterium]|uniref:Hsp20/alpha crystallin family protein n=1 Tax=Candidatus Chlorohelix allophototropha TaxID=3003348 RepID=A0A8T7LYW2_9CHLR|nr:Hsp20/alpha crystallin family protein [Chloroflexota bacterium]WJW65618.1 Hsp20/alpha crystallin family protein [Chloroflexota bacterium L227-S17]
MTRMIIRPSLFDEVASLNNIVNELFDNTPTAPYRYGYSTKSVTLNVYEDNGNFYLLASLPGIDPKEIELNVKDKVLTISGEYDYTNAFPHGENDNFKTHLSELGKGKFFRQVKLPIAIESEKIEAVYENGLLRLTLPKSEQAQVKRISIQTVNPQTVAVN